MRWSAQFVTGSFLLGASSWAGLAMGVSFDEALGLRSRGVVVQGGQGEAASREGPQHLATDTPDALVSGAEIDEQLLAQGLVHEEIEGPIGSDDPSVLGYVRVKPRIAVHPVTATVPLATSKAEAEPASASEAGHAADASEPALITDRVSDAEEIESSAGWFDEVKASMTRMFRRSS